MAVTGHVTTYYYDSGTPTLYDTKIISIPTGDYVPTSHKPSMPSGFTYRGTYFYGSGYDYQLCSEGQVFTITSEVWIEYYYNYTPTYTIGATVNFDPSGGSVSPPSSSGSATSQSTEGYVSIYFPTPVMDGFACEYWELRHGTTVYQTHYAPGAYNSIYANTDWQIYTAVAIWQRLGPQAYIWATKDGTTKWWPATPYIYDNGWHQVQPRIYDGGWH